MTDISCPYCSSNSCEIEYDLTWKDDRFPEYHVAHCKHCDIGFVLPLPTPEQLEGLYNSLQYHESDRSTVNYAAASDDVINARVAKDGQIVKKYTPHVPSSGSVLDIGAGWGTLLKSFDEQGYRTVGLEISELTSQFARDHFGLEIYNLPIERLDEMPDQTFDLITMRHTLEHFYDPSAVLSSLHSRLNKNGKIIIEVPDYGSFDRRSYGTDWPAFGPYHLWYFSRKSLIRVLNDNGFQPLYFHTFLSERVFGKKNFLHKAARNLVNRLGGKAYFSGRSIGLIAEKI